MRIRQPDALELVYTGEMMAGLLLRNGLAGDGEIWPRRALLIGLGAASLAKFMYRHCPWTKIDVVEINPEVVAAARQFFHTPKEDARFRIHIADGARFVLDGNGPWDYVLVDGYDSRARTGALDTRPFHLALQAQLSDEGLAAYNLLGNMPDHETSVARIEDVFNTRTAVCPRCEGGNVIVFAATGSKIARTNRGLRQRALALKKTSGLDLAPMISHLEAAGMTPGGWFRI